MQVPGSPWRGKPRFRCELFQVDDFCFHVEKNLPKDGKQAPRALPCSFQISAVERHFSCRHVICLSVFPYFLKCRLRIGNETDRTSETRVVSSLKRPCHRFLEIYWSGNGPKCWCFLGQYLSTTAARKVAERLLLNMYSFARPC